MRLVRAWKIVWLKGLAEDMYCSDHMPRSFGVPEFVANDTLPVDHIGATQSLIDAFEHS